MLNASDEVMREILALEQAKKTLSIRERAQDNFMVGGEPWFTDHCQHASEAYQV